MAGAQRQKAEKQRETTGTIAERTKTLTSHRRTISKNTFSRRAHPGKCRPKFAPFVGLEGNRGRSIHFISRLRERKTKKNRQRTGGCAANCAFSRFDPLTLSTRPTIARADAQNQRFALSLRGAQWAKDGRFGCAISRFSCKFDDKKRLFHLRRPLIPF